MRRIDADAMEEDLWQRVEKAEQAGDGLAAGMFYCMVLILRHAPTIDERDGEEQRNI